MTREHIDLWRKAADQGSAGACYNLGLAYANAIVVEEDPALAAEWFFKAADRGHVNHGAVT